jgi:hypothetical protein
MKPNETLVPPSRQAAKAWHIVDYSTLYFATQAGKKDVELEAVQYTPRYIQAAWDHPEATRVINRLTELRETAAPDVFVWAKYLYEEMLDRSQLMQKQADKYLRGYVVDACGRPATVKRIAAMAGLGLTEARVATLLKHLERVGLIERVALPERPGGMGPEPEDGLPQEPDAAGPAKQRALAAQKYGRKKAKPAAETVIVPQATGDKPLSGGHLNEVASQSRLSRESVATGSDKNTTLELRSLRPSASAEHEQRNPRPSASDDAAADATTADGRRGTADRRPLTADGDGRWPTADAETTLPTADRDGTREGGQDAAGGRRPTGAAIADGDAERPPDGDMRPVAGMTTGRATPPTVPTEPTAAEVLPRGAQPTAGRCAELAGRIDFLYDRSGDAFSRQVCAALGVPGSEASLDWRRQYEAIAAAWQRAQAAKLGPGQLDEVWQRSIKSAIKIGRMRARKKRFSKGPEAVWMHEFNRRLAAAASGLAFGKDTDKQCKVL